MSNEMSAAILRQVLGQVKANGGEFTAEHGEILVSVYSNDVELSLLQSASELVEKRRITRVEATPSGRAFYRVASHHAGANGGPSFYICFAHYCSCSGFVETTVLSKTSMCRHILGALLADATGKSIVETIPDDHYADLLCPNVAKA
ncbi:hypothetical protein AeNC1_010530 [Aphanomyces euteiches]|nr:hypothetical protein AeNC1_010530 [Aphanomyces euteiches]